jgi:hypothetical protein
VLHHKSRDPTDLVCAKTAIGHECYRLQPELGHGPLPLHVDVRRFPAVGAEEDETVRSITKYSRHRAALLAHMFLHPEERLYAEQKKVANEEAERRASAAPGSRSAAEAGGRRLVGSRAGASAVDGGFPVPLFRLRGGFTMPPWPRFQPPPRQTGREVLPHTAFRQPSSRGFQSLVPHIPGSEKCVSPLVRSRA